MFLSSPIMFKSADFSFFSILQIIQICNKIKIIIYNFIIKYIDKKNKEFINLLFT